MAPSLNTLHPAVVACLTDVARALRGIRYRLAGGCALAALGVGRPTQDVDVVVARSRWADALAALRPLTVDAERMGLPGEPEPEAILRTRRGPFIEVFPEGVTAAEICRLRLGTARRSPAGRIALTLRGSALVALINSKLASYLSAPDRIRDLGDVQSIIAARRLTAAFATRLHPAVRAAFVRAVPRR